jgi:hypothetical protein
MIRIRKNMPVSPASTEALTAVTTAVPCTKVGESCYGDENEWQQAMEDHTAEDSPRQEMVHMRRAIRSWRKQRWKEEYTW